MLTLDMTTAQAVSTWARKAREATERRDDAIRRMRDEGASLRVIAEAAGLTHAGIARVLAREQHEPAPS